MGWRHPHAVWGCSLKSNLSRSRLLGTGNFMMGWEEAEKSALVLAGLSRPTMNLCVYLLKPASVITHSIRDDL